MYNINLTFHKYLFFVKQSILFYQRSTFLGILWTLILPIVNGVILVAVYTSIFHQPIKTALFYVFPALFLWNYFVSTTSSLSTALNSSNVKSSSTSNMLFPLSGLFNFLPSFLVISIFLVVIKFIIFKNIPFLFILNFLPSFIIFIFFTLGTGLLLSALYVFFRDIQHIWNVICQITFFICPILFPESFLQKSRYWFLIKWNPMFYLIKVFRDPLINDSLAPLNVWFIAFIFSILAAIAGIVIFQKSSNKFIHFL